MSPINPKIQIVEYGQLAVLANRTGTLPAAAPQIYQWRSSQGVVEGPLDEWASKMGIAAKDAAAILEADPILAALNHLAADGWTLVHVEDIEPAKLTYDRTAGDQPYVKARWWLTRTRPAAKQPTRARIAAPKPKAKRKKAKSAR